MYLTENLNFVARHFNTLYFIFGVNCLRRKRIALQKLKKNKVSFYGLQGVTFFFQSQMHVSILHYQPKIEGY